ncbi:hypothetical protein GO755_05045 [Spirosoma sp. HMF4905]|uniref:Uncharacterized protein n=1 Tax=Spirosoma arboris TaxID=2682092 RepID=A0A7K1S6P2_9BACT|nr:hypothetical protein [Spirosoma arboris]MVM29390.1 hypothetical protein [Spirosoma arboris]
MRTITTVLVTLLVVVVGVAIAWLYLKNVAGTDMVEKRAAEQRIRDKYGNDVIID